jgi:uncharacterized delta-60 repeat protein
MRRVRMITVVPVVALSFAAATSALAAPGDLDLHFGTEGVATAVFSGGAFATAVAVQPDGAIVAVGATAGRSGTGEFAVARFLPDGSLDPSFGDAGLVKTAIRGGHGDEARSVAIQPNGRIVVAGTDSWERFAVVRYLPDGSLDPSFAGDGIVRTDFQAGDDIAWDVALQLDGRIVAVGGAGYGQVGFELARYRRDGSPDRSFGTGGRVTLRYRGANARSVAIQVDGRIVVSGYNMWGLAVARFKSDGSLDRSFADRGVLEPPTPMVGGFALAVQPNGRIVVAGDHDIFEVAVVRLLADGRYDGSFGEDGIAIADLGSGEQTFIGLALQPDGRIVAVAHVGPHEGGTPADWQAVVARFRRDGSLDATFGDGGLATSSVSDGMFAGGFARQDDGKLVVAGGLGGNDAMALLRLLG